MREFEIPKSWKWVKLSNLVQISSGGTPQRNIKEYFDGNIPWATPTDVSSISGFYLSNTKEKITKKGLGNSSAKLLPIGSILITSHGTIGETVITKIPMTTNQNIYGLICNEKVIHNEYLARYINWAKEELLKISFGTTFKALSMSYFKKYQIPLPTLPEQKAIVEILQQAERLNELREKIDGKAKQLKSSVFKQMFGEPFENEFKWERTLLGEVLSETPKDGPHESPNYVEQGIPFLSTRNVKPSKIIWNNLKYISREDAKKYWKRTKPEFGDILYTKGGTTGHAKVINFDNEVAVWVHLALLKPNRKKVNSVWLEQMLNTNYAYFQSQKLTRGAANKDLGLKRMVKIKIILPPLKLQEKYAKTAKQIDLITIKQLKGKDELQTLKENLSIQAFTGKLTQSFRQKEQFAISTHAKFRDETLRINSKASGIIQQEQIIETEKGITKYLSEEQEAILSSLKGLECYALAENDFSDLDLPSNQVQRNLDLLAAIGLIKAVNIGVSPSGDRKVFYVKAYRTLQEDDGSKTTDLAILENEMTI